MNFQDLTEDEQKLYRAIITKIDQVTRDRPLRHNEHTFIALSERNKLSLNEITRERAIQISLMAIRHY